MKDNLGNVNISGLSEISIKDNDPPEIIYDPPSSLGTGEKLLFETQITDNIQVRRSWIILRLNEVEIENLSISNELEYDIPDDKVGLITIIIFSEDISGNIQQIEFSDIQLIDIIKPIISHINPIQIKTGEKDIINIQATDNIGVYSIEWTFDGKVGSGNKIVLNPTSSGVFVLNITVSDEEGNIVYYDVNVVVTDEDQNLPITLLFVFGALILCIIIIVIIFILIKKKKREEIHQEIEEIIDSDNESVEDEEHNIEECRIQRKPVKL